MSKIPNAPVDPTVLKALAEIKEIYQKYDLGGHVVAISRDNLEFELALPKWVCAFIDEKTGTLRFRSIRGERSEEEQRQEQERSAAFLLSLRDVMTHQSISLLKLGQLLEEKLGVKSGALNHLRVGKAPDSVPH